MKTLMAKNAKHRLHQSIDPARVEQVVAAKHGQPIVLRMALERGGRLKALDSV